MAHTGGFIKTKKYHWKDSNLAMFGSEIERSAKTKTGKSEPAWEGAGTAPGLQIWRIVKLKVEHWPVEKYGYFYNGDTYIVLNTFVSVLNAIIEYFDGNCSRSNMKPLQYHDC